VARSSKMVNVGTAQKIHRLSKLRSWSDLELTKRKYWTNMHYRECTVMGKSHNGKNSDINMHESRGNEKMIYG